MIIVIVMVKINTNNEDDNAENFCNSNNWPYQ